MAFRIKMIEWLLLYGIHRYPGGQSERGVDYFLSAILPYKAEATLPRS